MKRYQRVVIQYPLRRPDPAEQASLFDAARPASELSLSERFERFHAANPHIFQRFHEMAVADVAGGAVRLSVKRLCEELRATWGPATPAAASAQDAGDRPAPQYRFDNGYTALYARLLVADPRLAGRIELRERRAE